MPLRPPAYREVKRRLEAAGFTQLPHRGGSHVKFVKVTPEETRTAVVPRHREVTTGTLRSILRQAGLTQDQFDDL